MAGIGHDDGGHSDWEEGDASDESEDQLDSSRAACASDSEPGSSDEADTMDVAIAGTPPPGPRGLRVYEVGNVNPAAREALLAVRCSVLHHAAHTSCKFISSYACIRQMMG